MFQLDVTVKKAVEEEITEQLFANDALSVTATPSAENTVKMTAFFQEKPEINLDYDYTVATYDETAWQNEETVAFHDTTLSCPNVVFGNGAHPTTKLALAAIDDLLSAGGMYKTGVDIGAGSGILAFHLAKYCPDIRISAIDIDPVSVKTIQENSHKLGLEGNILAEVIDITSGFNSEPVDILLVNLPIAVMENAVSYLYELTHKETRIILTGFTEKWIPLMTELVQKCGWSVKQKQSQDGWQLWVV